MASEAVEVFGSYALFREFSFFECAEEGCAHDRNQSISVAVQFVHDCVRLIHRVWGCQEVLNIIRPPRLPIVPDSGIKRGIQMVLVESVDLFFEAVQYFTDEICAFGV